MSPAEWSERSWDAKPSKRLPDSDPARAIELGATGPDDFLQIANAWHELYRSGVVAFGYGLVVDAREDVTRAHHLFGRAQRTSSRT